MRLRVDPDLSDSLAAHLASQGFPTEVVGEGLLEVLFPAASTLLEAAAELDLWQVRAGAPADAWSVLTT